MPESAARQLTVGRAIEGRMDSKEATYEDDSNFGSHCDEREEGGLIGGIKAVDGV